jgi:hypothetical protein
MDVTLAVQTFCIMKFYQTSSLTTRHTHTSNSCSDAITFFSCKLLN